MKDRYKLKHVHMNLKPGFWSPMAREQHVEITKWFKASKILRIYHLTFITVIIEEGI